MLAWGSDPALQNALLADGVAPEDLYPLDIERAFEKLGELQTAIPTYAESSGELLPASGFSRGAISYDQAEIINEAYVVWKDAPNKENAMRFLAYIMEPENQARWARLSNASPANPDAFKPIPEDVAKILPTSPANAATAVPRNDDWINVSYEGAT
jgi:putative spermidine/putrescine transport system substrate-binding protein